ncbi:hypothetical protein ACFQX7_38730 [Luedemannella flava]
MLEVALPAVVLDQLRVSPAWSAAMFVGNTALVIAAQVPVVRWLARWPRRRGFALSGVVLAVSYLGFWAARRSAAPPAPARSPRYACSTRWARSSTRVRARHW